MGDSNILTRRNTTLDFIKFIASFFVVFIHMGFYGTFGQVIDAVARFAVPLFFITSGYFCFGNTTVQIKKKLVALCKLLLFALVIYIIKEVLLCAYENGYFGLDFSVFNVQAVVNLVLFNAPIFSSIHLWFLYSLIYTYALQYLVVKFKIKQSVCFVIAIALLVLQIVLGEVFLLFSVEVPIAYLRNFIFVGFPFFTMGIAFKNYEEKVVKISNYILILLVALGVLESAFSIIFIGRNELYFGSILIAFALVAFSVKYPHLVNCKFSPYFSLTSTYIYIFHPIIVALVRMAFEKTSLDINSFVITNAMPIIACAISFVVAFTYVKCMEFIKGKIKIKN